MDTANKWMGQRFGKLVVVGPSDPGKGEYLFACDCGQSVKRNLHTAKRNTKNGHTVSCGCSRSYARMLGDNNPQRRKGQPKPMAKCEYCQKEFKVMGNRIGQKYCSVLCSNYVRARQWLSSFASSFRANALSVKPKSKQCQNCNSSFSFDGGYRLYCSSTCANTYIKRNSVCHWRAKRRRKEAVLAGDGTTINSLASEFGWVCRLCHEPIDPKLTFPDIMSPTIDHKVPLSRGGAHVKSNCQLAHMICNSTAGDSMAGKTIDLFCFASQ